jgi:beta-glucanase (GH16 family)
MSASHVSISTPGTLTLTAQHITGQPPASHGGHQIPINYLSGAVGAKQHFSVPSGGGLSFRASFLAPVTRGTWPAFWLTGVAGWPPEIDMAEWKGDGKISFNTFNTSSAVQARDVEYKKPNEWHDVECQIRDAGGGVVHVKFWLDGVEVATQYGRDYGGKEMYLVINLQMEGSSGEPGPRGSECFFLG